MKQAVTERILGLIKLSNFSETLEIISEMLEIHENSEATLCQSGGLRRVAQR